MTSPEIEKMADMENEYWWHIGKRHLVKALIKRHFEDKNDLNILDVGCGTGALAKFLTDFGSVTGFDMSAEAIEFCKSKGLNNVFVQDVSTLEEAKHSKKFNLIVALDFLEHVQHDILVMQKIREMLSEDGLLFVNVPAHKFLWSEHDEALEHKRRYHRLELTKKLNDAGFNIVSNSYFVTVISPLIILYRAWGNIFGKSAYPKTSYVLLPKKLNDFFVTLLKIETWVLLKTFIPFGVTLNVVARKNKS